MRWQSQGDNRVRPAALVRVRQQPRLATYGLARALDRVEANAVGEGFGGGGVISAEATEPEGLRAACHQLVALLAAERAHAAPVDRIHVHVQPLVHIGAIGGRGVLGGLANVDDLEADGRAQRGVSILGNVREGLLEAEHEDVVIDLQALRAARLEPHRRHHGRAAATVDGAAGDALDDAA